VQPRQAFLWENVSRRLKALGIIECTDMEMRIGR
jgi:hypothetical protein